MFPPTSLENIVISGSYRSANAELLDKLIVRDCEQILKDNPHLADISSVISKGKFHISAHITSGSRSLIINDIRNAIASLDVDLPDKMKLPTVTIVEQFFPLLAIAIFPKNENQDDIVEISKSLKGKIGSLPHIYSSKLLGKFDKNILISLDDKKIKAYGLPKSKIIKALQNLYLLHPIGAVEGTDTKYFISTRSSNISHRDILDSRLYIDGKKIDIKEIATVATNYEKHSLLTRTDGKSSLMIMTKKAKQGDAIKLSAQIKEMITTYKQQYPYLEFKILNDSSFWIKSRLNVVSANILIGLMLLFFAIWIFISLKIAIVVIIGIPVSFAFGIMGLDITGSSLNTLSMIGVLLSLGMLVDEAIVVSENIHRHTQMGKSVHQACIDGTAEVMPVLFVAMLTTIVAFLPLITLSGGLGAFIKIIPIIVIILVASSFVESFLFLPAHYSMFSKRGNNNKESFRDKMWLRLSRAYERLLRFVLNYKYVFLISFVSLSLFFSYIFIKQSRFILFPEFDAMSINITGKVKQKSLSLASKESKLLEDELLTLLDSLDVNSIHSTIGMRSDGRSKHEMDNSLFTITIYLKPKIADDYFNRVINPVFQFFGKSKDENRTRTKTAKEIGESLENILQTHKNRVGIEELNIKIPQTGVVKSDIAILISASNEDKIKASMEKIKNKMNTLGGVSSIKDDMDYGTLDIVIDINPYGKSIGFTQAIIATRLKKQLITQEISMVTNTENESVDLKLKMLSRKQLDNLENLNIELPESKQLVALKDIAHIAVSQSITIIKKENMEIVFAITADLDKKKMTSKHFYEELRPLLEQIKKDGVSISIKGEAGKNKQVENEMIKSLLFALLGILLIMTWFFGSVWLSLFSLSVIPLSLMGVLLGHMLLDLPLTFSTLLGFVGLTGIIMNDTLIMLSFIKKSSNINDLVKLASMRLRPILLTSITTILGLSTLIFFASGESLLMQPLAVSIGFGLLWATIVNLFYLPVGYALKR